VNYITRQEVIDLDSDGGIPRNLADPPLKDTVLYKPLYFSFFCISRKRCVFQSNVQNLVIIFLKMHCFFNVLFIVFEPEDSGCVFLSQVPVPDAGFTVVRFLADNPGYWLTHCHMSWHNHLGMGFIIKV